MYPLIQILIGCFVADVLVAFFHWWEDMYFSYCIKYPIFSTIAKDNDLHHYYPREILSESFFTSIKITFPLSICIILLLWLCFPRFVYTYPYMIISMFLVGVFSNILHKYSHMRDCELSTFMRTLYSYGILVGHDNHSKHHETPDMYYGVVFPITNYILEAIDLWRLLEAIVFVTLGVSPQQKMPYATYVTAVEKTPYHIETERNACPRVIPMYEVHENIRTKLDDYYACT